MKILSFVEGKNVVCAIGLALGLGCAADESADDAAADESTSSEGASSTEGSSSVAETSTGDASQVSVLEQCDAPSPCDAISRDPGSNTEEVDPALECALGQALDSIASGTALELSSSYCDIGCWGTDLLLVGDGTAYVQSWASTDVTSFEPIERCTLQAAAFFEACQGQPWSANGCTNATDWVMDCEAVTDAQCP